MQAHLRSCTVPENNWCSRVSVGACRTRSADTRSVLHVRLGKSPWSTSSSWRMRSVSSRGSSCSISVSLKRCDVEVLVAPSFRCDDRAGRQAFVRTHETLRGAEAQVKHHLSPDTRTRQRFAWPAAVDAVRSEAAGSRCLLAAADATRYFFSVGNGGSIYR